MGYTPRLSAKEHQLEALKRIHAKPSRPSDEDVFALLMEMGTGKTKVGLDEWGERVTAGELQDLLVIAPKGAYTNWWRVDNSWEDPGEIQKHLSPELYDRTIVAPWMSGGKGKAACKKRLEQLLDERDRPRVLVVNVEALSTIEAARDLCKEFLSQRRAMLFLDESTVIKSSRAERTKHVLKLGTLAAARRIATGLVAPKSPIDLFTQFAFLDWRIIGCKSIWIYRARYAVEREMEHGGRKFKVVVGFRKGAEEELRDRIAPYSYRILKEDCLDLDPKIYLRREIDMTPEQLRIYQELKAFATSAINSESYVTATAVITQLIRLDQLLCGFVVDEEKRIHDVPEKRTKEVLDVLADHSGKAVVWTAYDRSLRKLVEAIGKEFGEKSVAAFWGGNANTRSEDERRFKTDPECRFMVATPAAGGRGNTWTCANLNIYHSNTFDLEQRSQSEDRTHRHGQELAVTYVDIVCPGTIDEKKLKALRAKIDMSTAINGDNYREWLI